jgi:hypothetical protein
MLKFVLALSVLASITASADSVKLSKDAVALSTIEEIVSKKVVSFGGGGRPGGPMREAVSQLEVILPLSGCLDKLGPVTYSAVRGSGKTKIYLSATRIVDKNSKAAFCESMPTAAIRIPLGLGFADIKTIDLELTKSNVEKELQ